MSVLKLCAQNTQSHLQIQDSLVLDLPPINQFLEVDLYGDLYFETSSQDLLKVVIDSETPAVSYYSHQNSTNENLTYLEVSQPLELLLFYKDSQKVVLLDRFLNPMKEIVLSELSRYNGLGTSIFALWAVRISSTLVGFYDSLTSGFLHFKHHTNSIAHQVDIPFFALDKILDVHFYEENLYVLYPDKIRIYSTFSGLLVKEVFLQETYNRLDIDSNYIVLHHASIPKVSVYNLDLELQNQFTSDLFSVGNTVFHHEKFYVYKNNKVYCYSVKGF